LLVIFLALIPTKWHFYLALLLPCATVLVAYHLQALCQLKIFPARRGLTSADRRLSLGGVRLSQVVAWGLAAYLAVEIGRAGWRSAGANTLFVRLVRPQSPQAELARKVSDLVAGKSINVYSDLRIVPLLGTADFRRHCRWQPDYGVGEEVDLADSGEYLFVSAGYHFITYGLLEKNSQLSRFPPEKLMEVSLFDDNWTIYRLPQGQPR
jgi:hypothetical protein